MLTLIRWKAVVREGFSVILCTLRFYTLAFYYLTTPIFSTFVPHLQIIALGDCCLDVPTWLERAIECHQYCFQQGVLSSH